MLTRAIYIKIISKINNSELAQNTIKETFILYHAIKTAANQKTGKLSYTPWYCSQPSYYMLGTYLIDFVGQCIFYGML